jgi:hypothetical protein
MFGEWGTPSTYYGIINSSSNNKFSCVHSGQNFTTKLLTPMFSTHHPSPNISYYTTSTVLVYILPTTKKNKIESDGGWIEYAVAVNRRCILNPSGSYNRHWYSIQLPPHFSFVVMLFLVAMFLLIILCVNTWDTK